MKFKTTLALTVVFGISAIGGSAKEAPTMGPAERIITGSDRTAFADRSIVRSAGYGTDRGQIFLFADDKEHRVSSDDGSRRGLFGRVSRLFDADRGVKTERKVRRSEPRSKRIVRSRDRSETGMQLAYFRGPSLDEVRSSGFVSPKATAKRDRAVKKVDRRKARLKREVKKPEPVRRLSVAEARQLDSRMGPDRGGAGWVARTLASLKVNKPVTSDRKYGLIVERYARAYGVPIELAHAVIKVESNYRVNARGRAGEVGLMQIKPATARMMGYSGTVKGLYAPETNIKYGMKYLGKAHKLGGGTTCGTILKYNAGHGARRMNRISARYCAKVKRHLRDA